MNRREQVKQQLRAKFLSVARERLAQIGAALVSYEERPTDEALATDLMREIHTLKGEAKLVGFEEVNKVSHKTEELLLHARELAPEDRGKVYGAVGRGLDVMAAIVARESGDPSVEVDVAAYLAEADAVRAEAVRSRAPTTEAQPAREASTIATRQLMGLRGDSSIRIDLGRLHQLTELGSTMLLEHERMEHDILEIERSIKAWSSEIDKLDVLVPTLARFAESAAAREAIHSVSAVLKRVRASRAEGRRASERAREHAFEFRLRLRELDAQIRSLRLQPLSAMFLHYPKAVRDLANEQGKRVALVVHGADVEVDKEVLEKLADPLLHLIRNAVDHGLERPAERLAAGKSEGGTLTLRARQRGYLVEIRVSDDGRGMDPDRIRKAAVRKGILAANMAEARTDEEILSVVFAPGFSTAEQVTDVSGRGVGLDVVKANVEQLGGTVEIQTDLGRGTTFVLTAPIAMVFSRALLVESGGVVHAFPSDAVVAVVEVDASSVAKLAGALAIRHDEEWVTLLDMSTEAASGTRTGPRSVVVLEHLDRRLAVSVDRFLGERQVVQRSFDRYLTGDRLLAGAVVLDSGGLAILLDVAELLRIAAGGAALSRDRAEVEAGAGLPILVVDDSEVTRDLLCTILRSHGYEVVEAVNGKNGLERIEEQRPALVVTDLEMPVLDGFGLLREIRSRPALADLPVVVFSTRGSDPDKRKASELGADAYLVKGQFREEDLIGLAQRYTRS